MEGAQIEASSWFLPEDARAPTSFSLLHREALPIPSNIKLSEIPMFHKSVNINLCVLECNAIEWDFSFKYIPIQPPRTNSAILSSLWVFFLTALCFFNIVWPYPSGLLVNLHDSAGSGVTCIDCELLGIALYWANIIKLSSTKKASWKSISARFVSVSKRSAS